MRKNSFWTKPSLTLVIVSALMLSACMVGPNYHRPLVQTPTAFRGPDDFQQSSTQAISFADLPWWQVCPDPQLQDLIRKAL